jgi:enoyl-CoA hydratase
MGFVDLSFRDRTAVVEIARPPVNAFSHAVLAELRSVWQELTDHPPNGVVLTGAGSVFCAGIDVKELASASDDERRALVAEINAMVALLYGLPTATVAAVNGHAIGAGVVVALACDFRLVADTELRLGLTEVTAGVSYPAGPMAVVNAELDPGRRRRLVLTGELLDARQAIAAGLVDECVDAEQLVAIAVERATTLASAPGYATVKRQLRGETIARLQAIVSDPATDGGLTT